MEAQLLSNIKKKDITSLKSGTVIAKNYLVAFKIGMGAFGNLYAGVETKTNKKVAIKIEGITNPARSTLFQEAKILQEFEGVPGFPKIHFFIKNSDYNILVMSLLGKNLESIIRKNKTSRNNLKPIIMIAIQLLTRIESLHKKGFVHRDIKPENFVVGPSKTDELIYIVDFGLSKKFLNKDGKHIPFKKNVGMCGTLRYTSVHSHMGYEQSRRDDLWSIGYVLIYFIEGTLPWINNIKCNSFKEKNKKLLEMKMEYGVKKLCEGLPEEFADYFSYVKGMNFEDEPDYNYLKELFMSLMSKSSNSSIGKSSVSTADDHYDFKTNMQKVKFNSSNFIPMNSKINKYNSSFDLEKKNSEDSFPTYTAGIMTKATSIQRIEAENDSLSEENLNDLKCQFIEQENSIIKSEKREVISPKSTTLKKSNFNNLKNPEINEKDSDSSANLTDEDTGHNIKSLIVNLEESKVKV